MNARARGLAKASVLLGMIAGFVALSTGAQAGNDGVTLAHVDGAWQVTLDQPLAWEVKLIDPAPQEIACGTNYGSPCDATVYRFTSTAACVTVQIDWRDGAHNSTDPRACRDTTPEPTEEQTWPTSPTEPQPSVEPTPSPTTAAPSDEPSTTPTDSSTSPAPTTTPPSQPPTEPPTSPPSADTTTSEPSPPSAPPSTPSATPDPTGTPTTPAPIHCDPGYAPGWLDEHGNPTGCVWNGTTTNPEPEENPWPTPSETKNSTPPNVPSSGLTTPTGTPAQKTTTVGPLGEPPSPTLSAPQLASTGSDTAGYILAASLTLLLGAYLTTTNQRRMP